MGDKYAGKWAPTQDNMTRKDAIRQYARNYVPDVHNTSDSNDWAAAYQTKYAGSYEGYMKENGQLAKPAPCENAADCKSVNDLQAWRKYQMHRIQTFVPEAFQSRAKEAVDVEFHKHEVRLQNTNAMATPIIAQAETASALAVQDTSLKALSKPTASEKSVNLATAPTGVEQGSIGAAATICMMLIGGTVGVFFATKKPKDETPLEGYTSLLV